MNTYAMNLAIVLLVLTAISGSVWVVASGRRRWYIKNIPGIQLYYSTDPRYRRMEMSRHVERWSRLATYVMLIVLLVIAVTCYNVG